MMSLADFPINAVKNCFAAQLLTINSSGMPRPLQPAVPLPFPTGEGKNGIAEQTHVFPEMLKMGCRGKIILNF